MKVKIEKILRQGVGMWYVSFYSWKGCECSKKLRSALINQDNEPTEKDVINYLINQNENRN